VEEGEGGRPEEDAFAPFIERRLGGRKRPYSSKGVEAAGFGVSRGLCQRGLRGAGPPRGDAIKSMTTYVLPIEEQLACQTMPGLQVLDFPYFRS
jgi:hypothetical protein